MHRNSSAEKLNKSLSEAWNRLEILSSELLNIDKEEKDYDSEVLEILDIYGDPDEALIHAEDILNDLKDRDKNYCEADRYGDFEDIEYPDYIPMQNEYHRLQIIKNIDKFQQAIAQKDYDIVCEAWGTVLNHIDESSIDLINDDMKEKIYEVIDKLRKTNPIFLYKSEEETDLSVKNILIDVTTELYHEIARNPKQLYKLTPREFEEFIADIFLSFGFTIELTAKTRDGGRDIVAIGNENNIKTKFIIECKRFSPNKPVGISYIRELYAVKQFEHASKAILATTSYFTKSARQLECQYLYELELKDYNAIVEWVQYYSKWLNAIRSKE